MDRLRYEARALGWRTLAPPPVIAAGCALIAVAIHALTNHGVGSLAGLLTACLEMLLPLAAGISAATLPTQDASIELSLSLPTPFAHTILRRFGLALLWTALIAWLMASGAFALRLWHIPTQIQGWSPAPLYLAEQLIWLAPLLWLSAAGLCLALATRSPIASAAVLGGVWILETFAATWFATTGPQAMFLFPTTFTPFVTFWQANRLEVAGVGLALVALCWLLLRDQEALLFSAVAEHAS